MPRVLLFTRTTGFRHACIEPAVEALQAVAAGKWHVRQTEDPTTFTSGGLGGIDVVVFLNTSGDVLDPSQQRALEAWLEQGGGWVGIHAAADTERDWPWYGELLGGAWFESHPRIQPATITVTEASHPTLRHVPEAWSRTDEWYNYTRSPGPHAHVLALLDEDSYEGGTMGADHPIVWTVPMGQGVGFYTGLGHTRESWSEPAFLQHVTAAIDWAASGGWVTLASLDDRTWAHRNGWRSGTGAVGAGPGITAEPGTGVLLNTAVGRPGDLVSRADFGDCEVSLEFMVPEGGNSGVYLQGRYEVQILDSAGKTQPGPGDCGGIYERWDETRSPSGFEGTPPSTNAAKPAGTWQRYEIVFRAPRFGPDGLKTENARFERITHNGVVIHENVELTGPTRGGWGAEAGEGPIRLQGDHGPIAYRNIRVRRLPPTGSGGACTP